MTQDSGDIEPEIWETFTLEQLRKLHWSAIPDAGRRAFERWIDPANGYYVAWRNLPRSHYEQGLHFEKVDQVGRLKRERNKSRIWDTLQDRRNEACYVLGAIPWGAGAWFISEWWSWADHHHGIFAAINLVGASFAAIFWFLAIHPLAGLVDQFLPGRRR